MLRLSLLLCALAIHPFCFVVNSQIASTNVADSVPQLPGDIPDAARLAEDDATLTSSGTTTTASYSLAATAAPTLSKTSLTTEAPVITPKTLVTFTFIAPVTTQKPQFSSEILQTTTPALQGRKNDNSLISESTTEFSATTTTQSTASLFINNDLASRAALRLPSTSVESEQQSQRNGARSVDGSTTATTNAISGLENIFVNAVRKKTEEALEVSTTLTTTTTMSTTDTTMMTTSKPTTVEFTTAGTTTLLPASSASIVAKAPISSAVRTKPWEENMRLASNVLPVHYDILLHPDLDEGHFTGKVSIHLHLSEPRDNIYLHKKDLNVTFVELQRKHPESKNITSPLDIAETFDFEKNEFFVIQMASMLEAGDYILCMHFNGTMLGKNKGFYKSVYKNKYNDMRPLATSKFQPTYAREAFPCFDEPSLKSTFNVTLVHVDTMTALSNMPEIGQQRRLDGLTETQFAKSVPMVTYLACFIISDFKYIQSHSARGVPIRVYATPEQVENNSVAFALEVARHTLNFFEEYFNISYPLPKLDLVAIPDFVSGAMEHWGLITFREVYLLYDPNEASSANKQRLASVISHEMAHQWFGNLVTTAWWDSLWLNEGFASYMEYYGLLGIEPEWNIMEYFVVGDQQYVMTTDARVSSHPIVVPGLTHPDDIAAIFDSIPYSKGASIIRMLENFMGAETFRLGIVRFLNKHIYSTATTDDLWFVLNEQLSEQHGCNASKISNEYGPETQCVDIKQVMDTWLLQMNFPVLHWRRMNDTHGVVQQRRFLLDPSKTSEAAKYESPFDYTWYIPVTYLITQTASKGLMWMRHNESTILFAWPLVPAADNGTEIANLTSSGNATLSEAKVARLEPALVKLNPGQYGFYKVNYDLDTWYGISDRLNQNIEFLPDARDRSGVLDDAFDMARAGIIPYTVPLSMLRFLRQEKSLIVWMTASRALNFLSERLQSSPAGYSLFRQFVRTMSKPALTKLGWKDEGTHVERRLRPLLMGFACEHGDADCLGNVTRMFNRWVHNGIRVPANFRSVVYNYGMRYAGGEVEWQFMVDQLQTTLSPQESRMLLYGLTQSREPWQLNRFLHLAENETFVRRQDFLIVLEYMAANPVGLPCCLWDYFRTYWPNLVARFTLNDRYLGRILPALANYFNEELRLNEVKAFIDQYPEAGAGKLQRQQALETLEGNIAWLKRNERTLTQWLRDQQNRK